MDIINFPTPKRPGLVVELFDENCEASIIHAFDVTCPNCSHINKIDTGETAILKRVELYCGCCKKPISVCNPGIKTKRETKK